MPADKSIRELIDILEDIATMAPPVGKVFPKNPPAELPKGFNVVILNDNYTPFDVVIDSLVAGVPLSPDEAERRMLASHRNGEAAVAAYASKDIAETVAGRIMDHAKADKKGKYARARAEHRGPMECPLTAEVREAGDLPR
jgi:ATP-dependent Clp protease adaptor protein ClpS